jgi:uracil phosphoribosyltransferase
MSLTIVQHPLLAVALTELRNHQTPPVLFRRALHRAGLLIGAESLKEVQVEPMTVETPLTSTKGMALADGHVVLLPILRAGLGFVEALLELVPNAGVGHIGLKRDHVTLEPKQYYENIPTPLTGKNIFIVDPMLATGHSACAAIERIKEQKDFQSLSLITLLAAPEGVRELTSRHPEVRIFTGSLDEKLNEKGYIVPGLGDAGDRFFGTL